MCVLAFVLVGTALTMAALRGITAGQIYTRESFTVVFALSLPLVSAIILTRNPRNPVAWLLMTAGLCSAFSEAGWQYIHFGSEASWGSWPAASFVGWLECWIWYGNLGLTVPVLALFPYGRLPSSRWRWVIGVSIVLWLPFLASAISLWPERSPHLVAAFRAGDVPAVATFANASFPLIFIPFLGATFALLTRFRRSTGEEREQLRWFMYAAVVGLIFAAASNVPLKPVSTVAASVSWVPILLLSISICVAITRYHLYEIDRIINRTIVYALVSAAIAGVYACSVLLIGIASPLKGSSPVVVAISTLAAAALFGPVRSRIQRLVDRYFNRARYDAELTIAEFGRTLQENIDLLTLEAEVVAVVGTTMQPRHASLWIK
jgi:hypothetical protein